MLLMKTVIHQLPNDFFNKNLKQSNVYFYQTQKSSEKNKVNFQQNLLCLLLVGEKELYYADTRSKFNNTTLFLLPKGNTLMTEKVSTFQNYSSILLFFPDDFLTDFILNNKVTTDRKLKGNNSLTIIAKDDYIFNFQKSLLLLKDNFARDEKLSNLKTEEILLYLYRKHPKIINNFIQNALGSNPHFEFKKLISKNLYQPLSIEELAFLSNMSLSSFKRKFNEVYQTSPRQYFIKNRMEKAKKELLNNKRSSDFFYELGYENLSSFSHEFKKYFGMSPKKFAESL